MPRFLDDNDPPEETHSFEGVTLPKVCYGEIGGHLCAVTSDGHEFHFPGRKPHTMLSRAVATLANSVHKELRILYAGTGAPPTHEQLRNILIKLDPISHYSPVDFRN